MKELLLGLNYTILIIFLIYGVTTIIFMFSNFIPKSKLNKNFSSFPSASIIVPCKDEEDVIEDTLIAIKNQNYPQFEVIIVDDNSRDKTAQICENFIKKNGLKNFKVINRAEEHSNCSKALNYGIRYAKGDVLVFFDADNSPDKNCVKELLSRFTDDKIVVVQGRVISRVSKSIISKIVGLERISGFDVRFEGKEKLGLNSQFSGTVVAIKHDILKKFGGFNEKSLTEDTDLTAKIIAHGYKIVYERNAIATEEPVHNLNDYFTQHTRWATGHMNCCVENTVDFLKSPISIVNKLDGFLFLFYYFIPLLCGVALIMGFVNSYFQIKLFSMTPTTLIFLYILLLSPILEIIIGIVKNKKFGQLYLIPVMFLFYVINIFICFNAVLKNIKGDNHWVKTPRRYTKQRINLNIKGTVLASVLVSILIISSFISPFAAVFSTSQSPDTVLITTAKPEHYQSVFLTATVAKNYNMPMFLVNSTSDAEKIVNALPKHIKYAYIIGNSSSVSVQIENVLNSKLTVQRIQGENSTKLSQNVANTFFIGKEAYLVDDNWDELTAAYNMGNKPIIIKGGPIDNSTKTVDFNTSLEETVKDQKEIVLAEKGDVNAIDLAVITKTKLMLVDKISPDEIQKLKSKFGFETITTTEGINIYQLTIDGINKIQPNFVIPIPIMPVGA